MPEMMTFRSKPEQVKKYNQMVRAVVNSLLLNRRLSVTIDRDDLYQIGWVALIQCIPHFDDSRGVKFETYASRVIVNAVNTEILKHSKKKLSHLTVDIVGDYPVDETPINELMVQLIDLVKGKLDRCQKEVFWKRVLDDKTFEEIGVEIGRSRETARKIYNESLDKIKDAVYEHES